MFHKVAPRRGPRLSVLSRLCQIPPSSTRSAAASTWDAEPPAISLGRGSEQQRLDAFSVLTSVPVADTFADFMLDVTWSPLAGDTFLLLNQKAPPSSVSYLFLDEAVKGVSHKPTYLVRVLGSLPLAVQRTFIRRHSEQGRKKSH